MSAQIVLRRSVPWRPPGQSQTLVGIADMSGDDAVLAVFGGDQPQRLPVSVGDTVAIDGTDYDVAEIVVGDRGTVRLTSREPADQP